MAIISSGYACAQTARNALLTVCSDKIYVVGVVTELCETDQQVEIERACENWHAIIGQVSVQCGISPLELTSSLELLGIVLLRPSTLTNYGISETVTEMMMTGRGAVER